MRPSTSHIGNRKVNFDYLKRPIFFLGSVERNIFVSCVIQWEGLEIFSYKSARAKIIRAKIVSNKGQDRLSE